MEYRNSPEYQFGVADGKRDLIRRLTDVLQPIQTVTPIPSPDFNQKPTVELLAHVGERTVLLVGILNALTDVLVDEARHLPTIRPD